MKRLFIVVTLAVVFSALAFAPPASAHARLTPVKATHYHRDKRVTRHRAHKATKHRAPKRRRHQVA
jgi:hypothetical protein